MGRKVFISFLGTTNYSETSYYPEGSEDKSLEPLRFVQEATLKLHCDDFTTADKIYTLVTPEAKEKNWNDHTFVKEKEFKHGLLHRLNQHSIFKEISEAIDIPDAQNEAKIWEIFDLIFKHLDTDDVIIFDITHGFRSTPMLMMTLINYAKLLKNISVRGIYYGAFVRGSKQNPIIDITSLSELQDWTNATNALLKYGHAEELHKITSGENNAFNKANPFNENKDNPERIRLAKADKFTKNLNYILLALQTNRGHALGEDDGKLFTELQNHLEEILEAEGTKHVLRPILGKIKDKMQGFQDKKQSWEYGMQAVAWNIEHKLVQQAITMLQEAIITFCCENYGFDYTNIDHREDYIKGVFYALKYSLSLESSDVKLGDLKGEKRSTSNPIFCNLLSLYDDLKAQKLYSTYDSLSELRNDINHGGYVPTSTNDKKAFRSGKYVVKNFQKTYEQIQKQLEALHAEKNS